MSYLADNARFMVGSQACDCFVEDDNTLIVVEDEAFDYDGSFIGREIGQVTISDAFGVSCEYLRDCCGLAPVDVARDALARYFRYQYQIMRYCLQDIEGADILADMVENGIGASIFDLD